MIITIIFNPNPNPKPNPNPHQGQFSSEVIVRTPTLTYVSQNVEFIVNTSKLMHWKNLRTDMHVGLVRSGAKTFYLGHIDGKLVNADSFFYMYEVQSFISRHRNLLIFVRYLLAFGNVAEKSRFLCFMYSITLIIKRKKFHLPNTMVIQKG